MSGAEKGERGQGRTTFTPTLNIIPEVPPPVWLPRHAVYNTLFFGTPLVLHKQELLDTLRASEVAEHRERTQRKLQHQAGLPTSGRGSAIHWRHSDVLDWDAPPAGGGGRKGCRGVGLKGGRQHKESRRQALVFQRLRDGVRQIQEKQNSVGPVS